jgi:hypothetical protein
LVHSLAQQHIQWLLQKIVFSRHHSLQLLHTLPTESVSLSLHLNLICSINSIISKLLLVSGFTLLLPWLLKLSGRAAISWDGLSLYQSYPPSCVSPSSQWVVLIRFIRICIEIVKLLQPLFSRLSVVSLYLPAADKFSDSVICLANELGGFISLRRPTSP